MLNSLRQSRFIASLLIVSVFFISIQSTVNAAIISTSNLLTEQQSQIDRQYLLESLDRDEVQLALVSQGVDLEMAKLRVASMTNEEVRVLNAKIDELPAGSGVVGTIFFVLLVLLVTDLVGVTDVYPFIKK